MKDDSDRWYGLFGRRVTRRDFVRIAGDVAACIALSGLPVEAAASPRFRDDPFGFGVASGDPVHDGVVLWTRLAGGASLPKRVAVRWEVAEDEQFRRIVRSGSSPAPVELGHSVHAEVNGLRSGRHYWYRFLAGGQASAVGRTKTAPQRDDATERFRFAFASCQNYEHGYYTAYDHMADEDLDLVVHLGDYIYERRFTSSPIVRDHEAGEVITLDQYRARYSLYRMEPPLQTAHARFPWIVTTDDHEVENNYAGDVPEAPDPDFALRKAAAYQAFYEFLPLRRSALPSGTSMKIYRRLPFGRLLDMHVLDTRQYRTDQPCGDGTKPRCAGAFVESATMMGREQERWLERHLRESRATWNVLANQVMIAPLAQGTPDAPTYSMDRWDGYVTARARLIQALSSNPSLNPIIVTGDIHSNWVADLHARPDDPASPVVASEFVGTSISSGGDGSEGSLARRQAMNPHIKFFNGQRGYVRSELTPATFRSDYRVVPYVSKPGAPVETRASFAVEHGRRGVHSV